MWERPSTLGSYLTSHLCHCCDDNDPLSLKTAAEKEPSASQEPGTPERRLYCADENIERRNHYLDLAGVENFSSKFDNAGIEISPLFFYTIAFFSKSKLFLFLFFFFLQSLPLRSPGRMLTLLFSTTLWWSERTATPLSLPEACLSLIHWKQRSSRWGKTGTEERGSTSGYIANTLLHGTTLASMHHSGLTVKDFAPGHKTVDPHQGEIGRYFPTCSPHVEPWPLPPRDTSTITTMSTIIITTITTTLHKCRLNTSETGEKSWCWCSRSLNHLIYILKSLLSKVSER